MSLVSFLGVEIETGPGALIPRKETELLGKTAIGKLGVGATRAIDVCCGTGNLACGIAAAVPHVTMWALDLTDGCVELARKNVARLGLEARVTVLQGNLFGALPAGFAPVDLIVCNPPYISTAKLATRDDLAGEPREAFDGGPYGLEIQNRVCQEALPLLHPGGWLVMEFGLRQESQMQILMGRARGYEKATELVSDEAGAPRVIAARKKAHP